jgi:glycosyltransferase involved in cell wall biosynthesis
LISIGTLEPRKNQRFILQVLARLRQRGRECSLALIGDGPDRATLESIARKAGISGQVRFLGYVPNAANELRLAKIYVHAATMENCPIAVIEAMSRGLPVVALASGGVSELVTNGEEGLLFSDGDVEGVANALLALLDDGRQLAGFGRRARQRYERALTAPIAVDRLLSFLGVLRSLDQDSGANPVSARARS